MRALVFISLLPGLAPARPGAVISSGGTIERPGDVLAASVAEDGRVTVAGLFFRAGEVTVPGVVRLTEEGTVDESFSSGIGISPAVPEPGGEAVLVPCPVVLPWDGGQVIGDPDFGGGALAAGGAAPGQWFVVNTQGGIIPNALTSVSPQEPLMPQFVEDGKLVAIVGSRDAATGISTPRVRRLNLATGRDDAEFVPAISGRPAQAAPAGDGGLWVLENQGGAQQVTRLTASGARLTPVAPLALSGRNTVFPLPAGHVAVKSEMQVLNDWWQFTWSRELHFLAPDGTRTALRTLSGTASPFFVEPGGALLMDDAPGSVVLRTLWREREDGTRDAAFQGLRTRRQVQMLSDGRWLADGTRRYLADGTPDTAWQAPEVMDHGTVTALFAGPSGTIYGTGDFTQINGRVRPGIARWLPDGALDASFAPAAAEGEMLACAPQPDGSVLVRRLTESGVVVQRLLPNGALDPQPAPGQFTPAVSSNTVTGPGRLTYRTEGGKLRRYYEDGRPDPVFRAVPLERRNESIPADMPLLSAEENGGPVNARAMLLHPATGALWVAGDFTRVGSTLAPGLAVLSAEVPHGFSAWAAAIIADPALTSPEADADGDGCSNWREYAAGTDPSSPDAPDSAATVHNTSPLCVSAPLNPGATEVVQILEVSTDLRSWRTATGAEAVRKNVDGVPAFELAPVSGPRFVRLRYRSM